MLTVRRSCCFSGSASSSSSRAAARRLLPDVRRGCASSREVSSAVLSRVGSDDEVVAPGEGAGAGTDV
ncbi:MAG: hypothetical protein LC754_02835 [Acidobacteria bacterium]|nr:hypothetical protein [Acidobacteriota bacterium]